MHQGCYAPGKLHTWETMHLGGYTPGKLCIWEVTHLGGYASGSYASGSYASGKHTQEDCVVLVGENRVDFVWRSVPSKKEQAVGKHCPREACKLSKPKAYFAQYVSY